MTARILRDPNSLDKREPDLLEIRRVLVDMWTIISPFSSAQDGDYTLTGDVAHERVICTNPISSIISLNPKPADLEEFTIKRTDGPVRINGNGKTMDGESLIDLSLYDGPNGVYTDAAGEWSFV